MSKSTKKIRKSFIFEDEIESKLARHARHERKTQTQILREFISKLPARKETDEN